MTYRSIDVSGVAPIEPIDQPAPMLDWVPIARLLIDDSYQRPLTATNWAAIRKIAEAFHWSRFTPVLVAPVENGLFAIIDGQHRTHAAAICGFKTVPAMAVHMTRAEQASAFAWVNVQVVRITAHQVYRAGLASGEGWARQADDLVTLAGCKLMTSNRSAKDKRAGEIYAVQLVRDLVQKGHGEALRVGLAALYGYDASGRVALWSDYILRPWLWALATTPSALALDLVAFLNAHDPFKILQAAHAARAGGSRVTDREAIIKLLNRAVTHRSAA